MAAGIISGGRATALAPIGMVGIGTGGLGCVLSCNRQMSAVGLEVRQQFLLIVEHNRGNIVSVYEMLKGRGGRRGPLFILPDYAPDVDGFHGDPTAWRKKNEGLIRLDLDEMIESANENAQKIGVQPEIIPQVLSLGGGHAEIGLALFEMLQKKFENAIPFPIIIIPDDFNQYRWIRDYTWAKFEEKLVGQWALIIDNQVGDYAYVNDRLGIGLTALEACGRGDLKHGSLAEAYTSLLHQDAAGQTQDTEVNGYDTSGCP